MRRIGSEECCLDTWCMNAWQGMLQYAGARHCSSRPAFEVVLCDASTCTCEGGAHQSNPHLVVIFLEEALHQGRPLLQAFPQPLLQIRAPSLHMGIPNLSCPVTLLHCLTAVCLAGTKEALSTSWQCSLSDASECVDAEHADQHAPACPWR